MTRLTSASAFTLRSVPAAICLALWLLAPRPAAAHVGDHPSVHDTVAGIAERLRGQLDEAGLGTLTPYEVEQKLTAEERHILGTGHIQFQVDVPVLVTILRNRSFKSEPFWLRESFALSGLILRVSDQEFDVWQKPFPAGPVGLGINSLAGGGLHYLVLVAPQARGADLHITELYPGPLRAERFTPDMKPYVDRDDRLASLPAELADAWVVRTEHGARDDAKLVNLFRWTRHPATVEPDQLVLTWSGDPQTTQTLQWRTSAEVKQGRLAYRKKSEVNRFQPAPLREVNAVTTVLKSPNILNDPLVHRHVVELTDLQPGTTYVYSVGDETGERWSELAEFTTAPAAIRPFSFIYMGDAQNGLDRWGTLVNNAFRERPDAAFYVMAGDLVDRGNDRDDWDSFFFNAARIYDRRQLVPVLGNHEYQGGNPQLYLDLFTLPENGPEKLGKERAYWFNYSNALFVILDSNLKPEDQKEWLEQVLSQSKATWKFAVYHHPAYSSAPNRDNKGIREHWIPIFDKYHVDLALQGHDHAYLRTHPMKAEKRVASPKEGTVYIVSVSGTKMYDQADREYTEFGMTQVATYQTLDIQISGDRLVYRSYDIDGNLRDELVIQK
jgi:acid phosphatase type 7